jgi:hypothetical protein
MSPGVNTLLLSGLGLLSHILEQKIAYVLLLQAAVSLLVRCIRDGYEAFEAQS